MRKEYINPMAIKVCQTLQDQGYQSFIVGGCVRDLILEQEPKDWDITTNASPEVVMNIFPKTIPTGLKHGTVTVVMGEGLANQFEVTTFRVEGQYTDGRRPESVIFVQDVKDDLSRRDLTMNAIAYDPIKNELVDPYNGIADLKNGIIKAVGDPNLRFQEDGLRIMRVARFAARFSYQVDSDTIAGMSTNLETLKKVSKERIKDELCKTLMAKNPSIGLRLLSATGVLKTVAPNVYHSPDATDFEFKGDLETRLTSIYLLKGPALVDQELAELKFSNKEIKQVVLLFQLMGEYVKYTHKLATISGYKRFMSVVKNRSENWEYTLEQFCLLCDMCKYPIREKLNSYSSEIVFARKDLVINGNDLIDVGVPKGPKLKEILDSCYDEILEEPDHNFKTTLLDFVKRTFNW